MKIAKAFAPAHISGIFIIDIRKDSALSGSTGCGICLENGAVTTVQPSDETIIRINGKICEGATTLSAVKSLTSKPVSIDTTLDIPVGCGFAASGAGALSAVLALNEALSLDLSLKDLARAAHCAEVTNRTGLGDVTGMTFGGIVIRKKAGAPFIGVIDKIPCSDTKISWVSFSEISTKSVLTDELKKKSINRAGNTKLKELLKKPTLENLFHQSRGFATDIGLMSSKVKDAIEAVEAKGGLASQAMLGDTVFAINDNGALSEFGEVHESRINLAGAHLL
ncbi:MAG: pantoate kinase [Candidatus Methanoperedens sp.]|nr:pantoate kinase [Candidatus Methanoperedens sp.]